MRIEDVDAPRCKAAHAADILRTLDAFGFRWDGEVVYQAQRGERYRAVLERLKASGAVYACGCTRRELAGGSAGLDGAPLYPGTCRAGLPPGKIARAWRVRVSGIVEFDDLIQGRQRQDLPREAGDAVLLRADGLFAYQLAVVVDDAEQGIDHVVRGADLIHSTARQIHLQNLLGLPTPVYAHLPVAVDATGRKLSKQTNAPPLDAKQPLPALVAAASFLGQNPPDEWRHAASQATIADFWTWAQENWQLARVPRHPAKQMEEILP